MKKWFVFKTKEQKGIFALLLFIAITLFYFKFVQDRPDFPAEDFSSYFTQDSVLASADDTPEEPSKVEKAVELRNFDPNEVNDEDLQDFGVEEQARGAWLKYLKAGGRFYQNEDLLKIYGLSSESYNRLKPYLKIETLGKPEGKALEIKPTNTVEEEKPVNLWINVNQTDSAILTQVPGIGPYYAGQIIELRNNLGGIVHLDQLLSLYRMNQEKLETLSQYLYTDGLVRNAVNVNQASVKDLAAHPYLDWNLAKLIVKYRNQHGEFSEVQDLKKIALMHDSIFSKIAPYIETDESKQH